MVLFSGAGGNVAVEEFKCFEVLDDGIRKVD